MQTSYSPEPQGSLTSVSESASMEAQASKTALFGYPVHLVGSKEARAIVEHSILQEQNLHVITLNPEMIMQGDQDTELGRILKASGLALPDGAGVVWALKRQGHYNARRMPGIEFSESVLKLASTLGYRVALVGAAQESLDLAAKTLKERYQGLQIVYTHHGFFQSGDEAKRVAEACAASAPQIVLVALGVPRQEKWIDAYKNLFKGTTFVGIGGSFDVWSGLTQRAPRSFRALNMEWLYRIATEPWRIRRIYKTLPMFVVKVLLSKG